MIGYTTVADAATRLGVCRQRIYHFIDAGRLTRVHIAGRKQGYVPRILLDDCFDREMSRRGQRAKSYGAAECLS